MDTLNSHNFEEVYKALNINLNRLGCVMVDVIPLSNMLTADWDGMGGLYVSQNPEHKWIRGWIAGEVSHITLLYGLLENAHTWEEHVRRVLQDWQLNEVEIDHISYFDNPYIDEDYYCIVAHIKVTPALLEGHQRLEFLPHINTFNGYKPHMTICYIRKDEELRDRLIKQFNDLWAGKKLMVRRELNLGYLPK